MGIINSRSVIITAFIFSLSCNIISKKSVIVSLSNETIKSFDSCALSINGIQKFRFTVPKDHAVPNNQNITKLRLDKGNYTVEIISYHSKKTLGKKIVSLKENSYLFLVFTDRLYYKKVNDTCLINLMDSDKVGAFL